MPLTEHYRITSPSTLTPSTPSNSCTSYTSSDDPSAFSHLSSTPSISLYSPSHADPTSATPSNWPLRNDINDANWDRNHPLYIGYDALAAHGGLPGGWDPVRGRWGYDMLDHSSDDAVDGVSCSASSAVSSKSNIPTSTGTEKDGSSDSPSYLSWSIKGHAHSRPSSSAKSTQSTAFSDYSSYHTHTRPASTRSIASLVDTSYLDDPVPLTSTPAYRDLKARWERIKRDATTAPTKSPLSGASGSSGSSSDLTDCSELSDCGLSGLSSSTWTADTGILSDYSSYRPPKMGTSTTSTFDVPKARTGWRSVVRTYCGLRSRLRDWRV